MNEGLFYIATANQYLAEAKVSAISARQHNDVNIAVLTSKELEDEALSTDLFDEVVTIDSNNLCDDIRDKIRNIGRSPYDKTIYVDNDTYVLGDISPVFDLLDRFEITAAHAPVRPLVTLEAVPDAFPELNTGVIGFRLNQRVQDFFKEWQNSHDKQIQNGRPNGTITLKGVEKLENTTTIGKMHGQPPFREALYLSDLQFSALPKEYNYRELGWAYGQVKILHIGHGQSGKMLKEVINDTYNGRLITRPHPEILVPMRPPDFD